MPDRLSAHVPHHGAPAIPHVLPLPPADAEAAGSPSDAEIDVRAIRPLPIRKPVQASRNGVLSFSPDECPYWRLPAPGRHPSGDPAVLLMASAVFLIAGVGLAAQAHRFGARVTLAETLAGALLILGLALIGFGLPVFR